MSIPCYITESSGSVENIARYKVLIKYLKAETHKCEVDSV